MSAEIDANTFHDDALATRANIPLNFACNGCGRCCQGHHVPLTLRETMRWIDEGGQIVILTEGFHHSGYGVAPAQFQHAAKRSQLVGSGHTQVYVTATFAAFNPGRCHFLQEDNTCRIYEHRPLVCRIYPAEINPHIVLDSRLKDCPSEVWERGPELICKDGRLDAETARLVEESRMADRADASRKIVICSQLGIANAALKGDGFMAWIPDTGRLKTLLSADSVLNPEASNWSFIVSSDALAQQLLALGANAGTQGSDQSAIFIPLNQ